MLESFLLSDTQVAAFLIALLGGILTKSLRELIQLVGALICIVLFVVISVVAYRHQSSVEWLGWLVYSYLGGSSAKFVVRLADFLFGKSILFSSFFPGRHVFFIEPSQMDFHEVVCQGYKLRLPRPSELAREKYFSRLSTMSSSEVAGKDEATLLEYLLDKVGGKESQRSSLAVTYSVNLFKGDDLLKFDNAKRRVTELIYKNIFSRYTSNNAYSYKVVDFRVDTHPRPIIRYAKIDKEQTHFKDYYFHMPINRELMLSLTIDSYLGDSASLQAASQIIDYLLNTWEVSAEQGEEFSPEDWQGWQSLSWAEVEPAPLSPGEFISESDFEAFLQQHAEDPLMWEVFKHSANYKGWFAHQYRQHKAIFKATAVASFKDKLANYSIAEKLNKSEAV
ncbi:MAG TPA: hypothetical protein VN030_15365 [Cellvibrio sp.]|nr:hypothetical protein [Cellvibrio sp.]